MKVIDCVNAQPVLLQLAAAKLNPSVAYSLIPITLTVAEAAADFADQKAKIIQRHEIVDADSNVPFLPQEVQPLVQAEIKALAEQEIPAVFEPISCSEHLDGVIKLTTVEAKHIRWLLKP